VFFTFAHRRSCSILQRSKEEDLEITEKMSNLIDGQVDNASHDFDKIKQDGCEHGKEKKLNIDVDKILGLKGDDLVSVDSGDYGDIYGDYEPDAEVLTAQQMRDAVNSASSELELSQKTLEEIKEEAVNVIAGRK